MTLETFAKKTGWPLAELMDTGVVELSEVLALMGLELSFERHTWRVGTLRGSRLKWVLK